MPTCANPRCGAEFTPRRKDQRACSNACSDPARRADPTFRASKNAKQNALAACADPAARAKKATAARAYRTDPDVRAKQAEVARTRYQTAIYGQPTEILMQTKDRFRHARALGFRSGLEVKNARHLEEKGAAFEYEPYRLPYVKPERNSTFTPDFCLPNGVIIDTKGLWDSDDRAKFALVKAQHPDLDIRMVFSNPNAKISKGSKTSYADVCQKIGLPFAKDLIPTAWLQEPPNEASLAAIERLRK